MIAWFKQLYARFIRWFGDGSLVSNPQVGFKGRAIIQPTTEKSVLTYGEPKLVSTLYPNTADVTLELTFTNNMHILTPTALRVYGTFPKGTEKRAIVDEHMEGKPTAFEAECIDSFIVKNEDSSVVVFSTVNDYEGVSITSPANANKPHKYPWVVKHDPEQVLSAELEEACKTERTHIREITIEDYPWVITSKPGLTHEGVDRMVCVYLYYDKYVLEDAQKTIDEKRKQEQAKASLHNFINGKEGQ